jgi:hypothetical protein
MDSINHLKNGGCNQVIHPDIYHGLQDYNKNTALKERLLRFLNN